MAAGFEISFIDTETARWLEDAPDDGLFASGVAFGEKEKKI